MASRYTSVKVDRELWKQFKMQALSESKTVSALTEQVIVAYLKGKHQGHAT